MGVAEILKIPFDKKEESIEFLSKILMRQTTMKDIPEFIMTKKILEK